MRLHDDSEQILYLNELNRDKQRGCERVHREIEGCKLLAPTILRDFPYLLRTSLTPLHKLESFTTPLCSPGIGTFVHFHERNL